MDFIGFSKEDFNVFAIEGLEARMDAIKLQIQPKFQQIGQVLCEDLAAALGNEMFLHIAKHARRTVNPPKDTWLSISANKRGYKQHPHFQLGLFDDHIFIWLAFIYELPNKEGIARSFLANLEQVNDSIPSNFAISTNHMKKDAILKNEIGVKEFKEILTRFKDVKKTEFLVGRKIDASDPISSDGEQLLELARETFFTLMPLYKLAFK